MKTPTDSLNLHINNPYIYAVVHFLGQRFSAFWAPKAHAVDPIRHCHVLLYYFKNKKHVNLVFRTEKHSYITVSSLPPHFIPLPRQPSTHHHRFIRRLSNSKSNQTISIPNCFLRIWKMESTFYKFQFNSNNFNPKSIHYSRDNNPIRNQLHCITKFIKFKKREKVNCQLFLILQQRTALKRGGGICSWWAVVEAEIGSGSCSASYLFSATTRGSAWLGQRHWSAATFSTHIVTTLHRSARVSFRSLIRCWFVFYPSFFTVLHARSIILALPKVISFFFNSSWL